MSFREKAAWVTFLAVLISFGFYFVSVGTALHANADAGAWLPVSVPALITLVVVVILVEVVAQVVIAARSPTEARGPLDERERVIELKATRPAFFVLMVGVWLALGAALLTEHVGLLVQVILFAVWIAELTRFGTQLYYYRQGIA
jgi:Na+/H+ antiporter NhaB